MRTLSLFDVIPEPGSVFVDNLMVSSVERLLGSRYDAMREDPVLSDSQAAVTLVAHDVLNLAAFLDTLICSEQIYVNAAFLDRWSRGAGGFLDRYFGDIIIGIDWPKNFQWDVETYFVREPQRSFWSADSGTDFLAKLVTKAMYFVDTSTDSPDRLSAQEVRRRLFMPEGETSRPFGSGSVEIGVGTGFYATCSDVLGVPYRPSIIRARQLQEVALRYRHEWESRVGGLILEMLSRDRDKLLRDVAPSWVERGVVELNVPATLTLALQQVQAADDILPWVCRLRNDDSAVEFRGFAWKLLRQIGSNDLTSVMESVRDVGGAARRVHQELGHEKLQAGSVGLNIGPVFVGHDVPVPKEMVRRLPAQRQRWLIQDIQRAMMAVLEWTEPIDNIIVDSLPEWLKTDLRKSRGLDLRSTLLRMRNSIGRESWT